LVAALLIESFACFFFFFFFFFDSQLSGLLIIFAFASSISFLLNLSSPLTCPYYLYFNWSLLSYLPFRRGK
jgi:hypothetical protein